MKTADFLQLDKKKFNQSTFIAVLPDYFQDAIEHDENENLTFEQLIELFNWYEKEMNGCVCINFVETLSTESFLHDYETTTGEIINTWCKKFKFEYWTEKESYYKPKKKVKFYSFDADNEKICVFLEDSNENFLSVFSTNNGFCSNYRNSILEKSRTLNESEKYLFKRQLESLGYNIEIIE